MASGRAELGGGAPVRWLESIVLRVLAMFVIGYAGTALAQGLVDLDTAERLGSANTKTLLAAIALVELGGIIYLFLALQRAQAKHHAETVETLTSVVTLSVKSADGLQVLDKAIDHFTQERKR